MCIQHRLLKSFKYYTDIQCERTSHIHLYYRQQKPMHINTPILTFNYVNNCICYVPQMYRNIQLTQTSNIVVVNNCIFASNIISLQINEKTRNIYICRNSSNCGSFYLICITIHSMLYIYYGLYSVIGPQYLKKPHNCMGRLANFVGHQCPVFGDTYSTSLYIYICRCQLNTSATIQPISR
jgi:hypothetical protein